MNMLHVLIVDDEPLIRAGIRAGLAGMPQIQTIAECSSGADAIEFLCSRPVDLVLLDVQLQDSTGLDVVERVGPDRMPSVIFVTAFDEYAIKAFELHAVDYLLKPFEQKRLRSSVERASKLIERHLQANIATQLKALLNSRSRKWPERIVVKEGERFEFVAIDSIDWIESANNFVVLHCGGSRYLLSESLSSLEGRLNPARFLRVHRGRIVNLARIDAVHPMLGGSYELQLRTGIRLSTGRQYKSQIQALLRP
jgi:two-component system, LytTR family, response regulator